jgi:hypothetical protein
MSPQQQMQPEPKRKRKEKPKLEFDAAKTFDVKAAEEIELDTETARYKAQKGEGGDRRG